MPGYFFNKVAGLRPATFLKRDSGTGIFCELREISKKAIFTDHLWATTSKVYLVCIYHIYIYQN